MTNLEEQYYLTNYEKDLLILSLIQLIRKYPLMRKYQILKDKIEMKKVQNSYIKNMDKK